MSTYFYMNDSFCAKFIYILKYFPTVDLSKVDVECELDNELPNNLCKETHSKSND